MEERETKYNFDKIFDRSFFQNRRRSLFWDFFSRSKKKKVLYTSSRLLTFCLLFATLASSFGTSHATTMSVPDADILAGYSEYNNISLGASNDTISLQAGDLGSWNNEDSPLDIPDTLNYPDMQYGSSNTIYMLTGSNSGNFKRYWVEERRWEDLAQLPFANFSRLVGDGSRYFYTIANSGFYFYRYDSFTDVWEKMQDTPNELAAGSNIEYVNIGGGYIYAVRGGNSGFFWRFSVQNSSWESLPTSAYLVTNGSSLTWDRGDYIYMMRGGYTYRLYRYQISTGTWTERGYFYSNIYDGTKTRMIYINSNEFLSINSAGYVAKYFVNTNTFVRVTPAPSIADYSMSLTYDGVSRVYFTSAVYGTSQSNLRYYNYQTAQWDDGMTSMSSSSYYYDAYAYDGADYLYQAVLRNFYRKDLVSGVITALAPIPNDYVAGSYQYMVCSGDKLYFVASGYANFYQYDIPTGVWSNTLASAPAAFSSYGTRLVDGEDGFIYASRGGNSQSFWRYNIVGNAWETLTNIPFGVNHAGDLVKVATTLYAFQGDSVAGGTAHYDMLLGTWTLDKYSATVIGSPNYFSRFASNGTDTIYFLAGTNGTITEYARRMYSYNVNTKIWKRLADMPQYARGITLGTVFFRSNELYVIRGDSDLRIWKWTPTASTYKTSGTWYSKHYDLTQASSLDSLTYALSGSGTFQIYTRTSDNLASWDNWLALNGSTIASTPKRYFQFKVVLSSDGSQTRVLSDFVLNYTQELTAPSLPTQFRAYSDHAGVQLVSGQTYPYHHPYFDWSGSDDGINGSGVEGYYVYFGSNANADPVTLGTYQTGNSYYSNLPFSAGDIDYLRIKVKDKLGNISSAATMFSYRYWFVSPPSAARVETQADFQLGTSTNVNVADSNGAVTLNHRPEGSWSDGDLAKMPQTFKGGAAAYSNGNIYTIMGNNTQYFYRYDIEANQWLRIADVPVIIPNSANGSIMRWDGDDTIYVIAGANSTAFFKYAISRNQWTRLNDLPSPAGPESAIGIMGNNKFIVSLNYSTLNYIYTANTDSFEENTPAPGNFITATNLYYDGTDTVYTMMEGNWLRKFVISENRWYTLMRPPAYFTDTQNISFEGLGDDLYMFANRNAHGYQAARYSISDNQFYQIENPPMETSSTSYIVTDNIRYVYIMQNAIDAFRQDNIMIRYDTVLGRYTPELYAPGKSYYYDRATSFDGSYVNYGTENAQNFYTDVWSSMAFDGVDTVYYKNYSSIVSYSVSQKRQINAWRNIQYNYGHIAYSNGYLYMTVGNGSSRFVRQNLSNYEWEELASTPASLALAYSQNLLVDKEGRLYAARAGGSNLIYRYLPGTNSWETLANAPAGLNTGSNIAYDGTDRIYVTFGSGSKAYYYYSISTATWSSPLANIINDAPGAGVAQLYHDGKIFMLKGGSLNTSSVYDTAANTWQVGVVAPTTLTRGSGFVKVNEDFALMAPSGAKSAIWRFNFPDQTKGCNSYGTYTSKNFLIEGAFSYVGLEANLDMPENTSVLFQTRTTADGSDWSDWQDVSEVKLSNGQLLAQINSPLQKNIQVRAILISYNGYDKPVLYDFKVNYFSDTTPPNNPTVLKVYENDQKTTEYTNNTWYNTAQPYLDWPDPGEAGGATDGLIGSNISGYYIYIGPDAAAIPESQGVLAAVSNYQPTLTSSGLYYINIQAIDGSGNIAEDTFFSFLYKFDMDAPPNPAAISADPAGYSNQNEFSFSWLQAIDEHSGVQEYCYKTAATEGVYATEQCQGGTSISSIPAAYQQGANILYVRTKDFAGNYSTNTQEITFYFNSGPPSRPANLRVDPINTIQNSYTFAWDPPTAYVGNVDRISYFYSVNSLPTAANTTRVEGLSVGPSAFATQAGANGFYLVAKDEAGNIDWNAYSSVTYYANTIAPGIPTNVTVADISSRSSSRWALALSWDCPDNLGSGVDHYIVERSEDKFHYSQTGTTDSPAYVDVNVSENVEYYYRIKAADDINNAGSSSSVVSMSPTGKYPEPPIVISDPEIQIGSNRVVIEWQTDRPCYGYINYGSAHDKLIENKGDNQEISDHQVTISGLLPNTVYYYKLQNFDLEREYTLDHSFSILRTFRTKQSPVIQDVRVSEIKLNSALISWNAQAVSNYNLLYGKSTNYGLSKEGVANSENLSITIDNLEHSSNYHFKIISTTIDGDEIRSDDYSFDTMSYPNAYDIKFQPVDGPTTSVSVSWKTNVRATSVVSYQLDANIKEQSDADFKLEHEVIIVDLADNASYKIQIRGVDEYGNNVVSEPANWRTAVDTRAADIANIKVEPTFNSSGGKSQLIVTWETDEPATSQVEYGKFTKDKSYQSKTALDPNLTTRHIVIIPDLDTTTSYHVRPISQDKSGNTAYGQDTIAVIGQSQSSLVKAIFRIFESLFSWLSIN